MQRPAVWESSIATRTDELRVAGLRLRVLRADPERQRDEAVLLVHGLAGWAENWREVMPGIAATGRPAIAFDLPGFGLSERPRRARYFDPDEPFYAELVHELADGLGLSRFHMAGHSLGGAIAYTAAVWRPERIRSLTLVAPGGLGRELARQLRLLTLPGMGLIARWRRSPALARAVLFSCFHDPSRCSPQLVDEAIRYGAPTVGEMISVLRAAVTLRGIRDAVRLPWAARAARYRGPALVVWGRDDRIIPAAHAVAARELVPEAEVRIIPECGHLVMAERPRELLDALLPFLDAAS